MSDMCSPDGQISSAEHAPLLPPLAIVSMGEMGAALASRLVAAGIEVRTSVAGRGTESRRRAEIAGVKVFENDVEMVSGIGFFFSVVPPEVALQMAERFNQAFLAAEVQPVYVDCNAISPARALQIERAMRGSGARTVDASILGLAPLPQSPSPRIYVSGKHGSHLSCLVGHGLDFRVMPDSAIGAASALKCTYAAVAKSVAAITAQAAMAAQSQGIAGELREELSRYQPGLWSSIERDFLAFGQKAYRWKDEMMEIAACLSDVPGGEATFEGLSKTLLSIEGMRSDGSLADLEKWVLNKG